MWQVENNNKCRNVWDSFVAKESVKLKYSYGLEGGSSLGGGFGGNWKLNSTS